MKKDAKILLVRTDRIGDVTLTTPAAAALRSALPGARLHFLTSAYAAGVLENNPALEKVMADGPFFATLAALRREKYDAAVIFFLNFRVALLALLAGIPLRVGPASKIWAVFLNKRITQRRSQAVKHEADYNLELLSGLGLPPLKAGVSVTLTAAEKEAGRQALLRAGASPGELIVGMHPGSLGSAMNWPPENFAALGARLMKDFGARVLLTGAPAEAPQLRAVAALMPVRPCVLAEALPLRHFIGLISHCTLFVANSTGPLHLAVSQGVPTLSFFPPIKVCLPLRWGPYGDGLNTALVPPGPVCARCDKKDCRRYSCMAEITPDAAYAAAAALLARAGRAPVKS